MLYRAVEAMRHAGGGRCVASLMLVSKRRSGVEEVPVRTRSWTSRLPELVSKAHRLLYHSTLGSRVINKKKEQGGADGPLAQSSSRPFRGTLLIRNRRPLGSCLGSYGGPGGGGGFL